MKEQACDGALLLRQSFDEFTRATVRLQDAYANLEEKFQRINRELERKNVELEQALYEKENITNYLVNILESLVSGVIVTDTNGRITLINEKAGKFSEVVQKGEKRDWRGALFAELFPDLPDGLITDKNTRSTERRHRVRGRLLEISIHPMVSEGAQKGGTIFVLRDITRLEKLEQMASRSEKFAAMGELAANIAHEVRNPLGSIELFASLLMKEPDSARSGDRAYEIIKSVKNVNNRISNLLLFTNRPQPVLRPVRLHALLDEVAAFATPIIENENIVLTLRYDGADPAVEGDDEMLKQVFLNLILNALQAMPNGGTLAIETKVSVNDEHALRRTSPDVEILFEDNGAGISPDNINRIFDPFFTTKEEGAGLGLAIVHNIIDMHDGVVVADSNGRGGTVMSITLPVIAGGKGISFFLEDKKRKITKMNAVCDEYGQDPYCRR